ncbi:MAG: hypothetical protein J6Z49_10885 [Kiritimatiellae bacterium]|nr:hypothetical protein [Kiritimatiellia bacterium]
MFVHPGAAVRSLAMATYAKALERLGLPIHPVQPFMYKPADGSAME